MTDKRISLVLGSGGARGLSHIGVIRCLEEHGYEISYIAGASIGALIGGIYAAGELQTYDEWVRALRKRDVVRLLDWAFSRGAVFSGERIINVLRELIGDRSIESLDIGFTAVATEINDKREIWLNKGPLFDAIHASIAMPLIFAPVEKGELLLVDGGLINPIPIAPTLNDDTALTVAVDLNGHAEPLEGKADEHGEEHEEPSDIRDKIARFVDGLLPGQEPAEAEYPSALEIALRSIDTMQTTISRMKLAAYAPRLRIEMPRNLCSLMEFHRAAELIEFGYERAKESLAKNEL